MNRGVLFWHEENVLKLLVMMTAYLSEHTTNLSIVHFEG